MTNLPPPDPRSSQSSPLGFDDFIGILVAFATIGTILFWALSRREQGFQLPDLLARSPLPAIQPNLTPASPEATASPNLLPTPAPTAPPLVPTPVPQRTPIGQRIPAVIPAPIPVPTPTETPATPAPSPTGQPARFVDVPDNYWARPFIDALSQRGIITGYAGDYFRPNQPVTRAEFAAILQDAFNQAPGETATVFKDIPQNFWATKAVDRATQTGFLRGYPGDVFRPEQRIPRAQVLVALVSGLKLASPVNPSQSLQFYKDAAQIPDYATEKIAAATDSGLVVNYPEPTLLRPNAVASRAEVSAIVHQALVDAGKLEPIQSEYVVPSSPGAPEASPPPETSPSPETTPALETSPPPETSPSP